MKVLVLLVVVACGVGGVLSQPAAAALTMGVFAFKQALQSYFDFLRSSGAIVNVAIAIIVAASAWLPGRRDRPDVKTTNAQYFCFMGLLGWAAITTLWSPGRESALSIIGASLPYCIVLMVVGIRLLRSLDDVTVFVRAMMLIGLFVNLTFLVNPEFELKDGRLILTTADGISSSPLSMGSFGAWTAMMGALERSGKGARMALLRLASVMMGISVVILSGSRGQLVAAVFVTLVTLPLAAPGRSAASRAGTIVSLAIVAAAFYLLFSVIVSSLPRFAAERFQTESILYSQSSATTRITGVYALLSAWVSSPLALAVGLGYLAYGKIPGGSELDVYVHNSYAESIFELGIPGAMLMVGGLYFGWRSLLRIHASARAPSERSSSAILIAMMLFECLIAAKQGSIWGLPYFFYIGSVAGIIERARADAEGTSAETLSVG